MKSNPPNVQLVGYYGWGNFGDDLFVDTVQSAKGSLWPGSAVRTFIPNKVGLHAARGLPGASNRLGRAVVGAMWAEKFALCGGSVLSNLSGVMAMRAKLFASREFEGLGVSVGPFASASDETEVRNFLAEFGRLVVRDHRSSERLGLDVPVGGDLAALSTRMNTRSTDGSLVIAPSAAAKVSVTELVSQIRAALSDASLARPSRIVILALNEHPRSGDDLLCNEIANGLSDMRLPVETRSYSTLGIQGVIDTISVSAAVWAQRLHAAIVAYLCEVPFLLVGHHAKCVDFGQDIGLDSSLIVPLGASWNEGAHLLDSARTVDELWQVPTDRYRKNARMVYGFEPDA